MLNSRDLERIKRSCCHDYAQLLCPSCPQIVKVRKCLALESAIALPTYTLPTH